MKRLTDATDAAFKGNPSSPGADAVLPNCAQKKSGSKGHAGRRKISLFKRISIYARCGLSDIAKARNSAISRLFALVPAWLQSVLRARKGC
jgi:hypothetical protein